MGLAPYALSVHHFISSVGADAGFASIIGLAVLVLLYFAQARETASLRDQADLAAQRVAQLESRLAQATAVARAPAPGVAPAPGFVPPPGVVPPRGVIPAPGGVPAPGVIPAPGGVPAPGVIPAAGHGPGHQPLSGVTAAGHTAPPAGVAAPPLLTATKLIPTPPAVGVAPAAAARIPAASSAFSPVAANPAGAAPVGAAPVGAAPVVPTQAEPVPANPSIGSPPAGNRIVTPRPATAAGAGLPTNGAAERPPIPAPTTLPPRPPIQIRPGGGGGGRPSMLADLGARSGDGPSDLTRILTALAAVAVVAAIVVVLISLTSGGSPAHTTTHPPAAVSNAPAAHHRTHAKPAVVDSTVTVGVLNGTGQAGLAASIATQLGNDGFKQGAITNAATQTQPSTTVEYVPGDQRDAAAVAKALNLTSATVQPITSDTQALGCLPGAACSVVVTVGADLANTQTATSQTQTQPAG